MAIAATKDGIPPKSLGWVKVRKERLAHNLNQYSKKAAVAPVLKSNAYGHGLQNVADVISDQGKIPFVSLAAYREVQQLRSDGHDIPALVIGYTPPETISENQLKNVHFTISTFGQLKTIAKNLDRQQSFHLKIETGMHRYGIKPDRLGPAVDLIQSNSNINLVGAFTHFSDAYTAESDHTKDQIKRWNHAVSRLRESISITYRHVAATSGHFYQDQIDADLQRIGIGLYGITDYAADKDLKPALSLHSFVAGTKQVAAGQPVGYSQSYRATDDMEIAVIPIGYQEGVSRRLSNAGCVQVNDTICPIIGKVSMNATMVDITGADSVTPRDPVVVYSADSHMPHSVLNQAATADTIPYDILTGLSPELERSVS
jgi:alanine racemase